MLGRTRRWISRHRVATGVLATFLVGGAVFVVMWFEPQKLFIDDRVNEALPTPAASPAVVASPPPSGDSTSSDDPGTPPSPGDAGSPRPAGSPSPAASPEPTRPRTLARGPFHGLEHGASGSARIIQLADGSLFLRFDRLNVSNGPDLVVYLSPREADDDWYGWDRGAFLDLGGLKGNIGSQNYALPRDLDLSRFRSAVVWCRRFKVGFAVAPLDPLP